MARENWGLSEMISTVGRSTAVAPNLSPLRGFGLLFLPRLAPWAAFFRRFAALTVVRIPVLDLTLGAKAQFFQFVESPSHELSATSNSCAEPAAAALAFGPTRLDACMNADSTAV